MKKNLNILIGSLITWISLSSLWVAFADDISSSLTNTWSIKQWLYKNEKSETIKTILKKQENGEELTVEESELLEKINNHKWKWNKGHKWFWKMFLTDEEKVALESMTDDEKKVFLETKKEEIKQLRDSEESVIDKLLAGETLTQEEDVIRNELIKKRAERKANLSN